MKRFNDLFALVLTVMFVGMWVAHGAGVVTLPGELLGVTTAVFMLVAQFYFRKSPPEPPVK